MRRSPGFLIPCFALAALVAGVSPLPGQVSVASPDGRTELTVALRDGQLSYRVGRDGRALLLPSLLGFELRGARPFATASASRTAPGGRTRSGGPSPGARWRGCATTTTRSPSPWRRPRARTGGSSSPPGAPELRAAAGQRRYPVPVAGPRCHHVRLRHGQHQRALTLLTVHGAPLPPDGGDRRPVRHHAGRARADARHRRAPHLSQHDDPRARGAKNTTPGAATAATAGARVHPLLHPPAGGTDGLHAGDLRPPDRAGQRAPPPAG